jgi:hypothetical protein
MATTNLITAFNGLVRSYAKPKRGLLKYFTSRPSNITDATTIEFHKLANYRYVTKARARTGTADRNDLQAFKVVTVTPPKLTEDMPFVLSDYDRAPAGSTQYDTTERQALMMAKVADDVAVVLDKMTRAEHLQVASLFHNGKILFRSGGFGVGIDDLDFEAPATNFATLSNAGTTLYWSNASADPWTDLETHCETVNTNSGGTTWVKDIIIGETAYKYMMSNSKFLAKFNQLKLSVGIIDLQEADADGFALIGSVVFDGHVVRLLKLTEKYISPADDSTLTSFVDPNSCLFIGEGSYQVYYAGIDTIKGIDDPRLLEFLPANGVIREIGARNASSMYMTTYNEKNQAVFLNITKFPLYVPETSNTFGRLTVNA